MNAKSLSLSETLQEELNLACEGKSLLSVEDLMKFLDCDSRTIYNWSMKKNPPPRLQIGRTSKFPRKEIANWMVKELFKGNE